MDKYFVRFRLKPGVILVKSFFPSNNSWVNYPVTGLVNGPVSYLFRKGMACYLCSLYKLNFKMMEREKSSAWELKKEELMREYPDLKEEDLEFEAGKEDDTIEKLKEKLKKNQEEIRSWLTLMG